MLKLTPVLLRGAAGAAALVLYCKPALSCTACFYQVCLCADSLAARWLAASLTFSQELTTSVSCTEESACLLCHRHSATQHTHKGRQEAGLVIPASAAVHHELHEHGLLAELWHRETSPLHSCPDTLMQASLLELDCGDHLLPCYYLGSSEPLPSTDPTQWSWALRKGMCR